MTAPRIRVRGFTLLELLVAMVILALAFTVVWRTFAATMDGWNRGNRFIERLHHGDFVIEQLVSALRSAAFYHSKPSAYGFWLDSRGGSLPRDQFSWVTSSSAFIAPGSPMEGQLHRLQVTIGNARGGDEGFKVRAWPQLADPDKFKPEEWVISTKVKGVECEVYDWESESWSSRWEDTNRIPGLVRVSVYLEPLDRYEPPLKVSRVLEIPIAAVTNAAPVNDAPSPRDPSTPPIQRSQNPNSNPRPTPP